MQKKTASPKKVVIDTNALLRFLLNDIPEQKSKTQSLLLRAKKSKIKLIVPQAVVFELNYILEQYYKFDKDKIIASINSLISVNYLAIKDRNMLKSALSLFAHANLSLVDCFLIMNAKFENAEIFSFDKNLKKYARTT